MIGIKNILVYSSLKPNFEVLNQEIFDIANLEPCCFEFLTMISWNSVFLFDFLQVPNVILVRKVLYHEVGLSLWELRISNYIWRKWSTLKLALLIFSPNDSPSNTMKKVFYFFQKALFVQEIFKLLLFFSFFSTLSRLKRTNESGIIYNFMNWFA